MITPTQYRVLKTMSLIGTCTQAQIAEMMHLSKSTVNYQVRILKKRGLVDSQGYTYWITIKGQGILEK